MYTRASPRGVPQSQIYQMDNKHNRIYYNDIPRSAGSSPVPRVPNNSAASLSVDRKKHYTINRTEASQQQDSVYLSMDSHLNRIYRNGASRPTPSGASNCFRNTGCYSSRKTRVNRAPIGNLSSGGSSSSLEGQMVFWMRPNPVNHHLGQTQSSSNSSVISFDVDVTSNNSDSGLDSASSRESMSVSVDGFTLDNSLDSCINGVSTINESSVDGFREPLPIRFLDNLIDNTMCSCNVSRSVNTTLGQRPECIGKEDSPVRKTITKTKSAGQERSRRQLNMSEMSSELDTTCQTDCNTSFAPVRFLRYTHTSDIDMSDRVTDVSTHIYECIDEDSRKSEDFNMTTTSEWDTDGHYDRIPHLEPNRRCKSDNVLNMTHMTAGSDMTNFMGKPMCYTPVTGLSQLKKKSLCRRLKEVGKFLHGSAKKQNCKTNTDFTTIAVL